MAKSIPGLIKDDYTVTVGIGDVSQDPLDLGFTGNNGLIINKREDENCSIITNSPIENMLNGSVDIISTETPIPLCLIPGPASLPGRVPYKLPMQEYMAFLPTAALALSSTLAKG